MAFAHFFEILSRDKGQLIVVFLDQGLQVD